MIYRQRSGSGMTRPPTGNTERGVLQSVVDGELEVDEYGNIWRVALRKGLKRGGVQIIPVNRRRAERKPGKPGYRQLMIHRNGVLYTAMAHRIVWMYFYGEIPAGMFINHKNGVKVDNRPSNLEIVSASENVKHAFRTGLKSQWGETNPQSKHSDADAKEIREKYATGKYRQKDLSEQFGIPFRTVSRILRGRIYPRAGGPISTRDNRHYTPRAGALLRYAPEPSQLAWPVRVKKAARDTGRAVLVKESLREYVGEAR